MATLHYMARTNRVWIDSVWYGDRNGKSTFGAPYPERPRQVGSALTERQSADPGLNRAAVRPAHPSGITVTARCALRASA